MLQANEQANNHANNEPSLTLKTSPNEIKRVT